MEFVKAISKSRVDDVVIKRGPARHLLNRTGSLAITGHHIIFSAAETPKGGAAQTSDDSELWLLHKSVDRGTVEPSKPAEPSSGAGRLVLYCKDFMVCVFDVASYDDAVAVCSSVQILSNLTDIRQHYPFFHRCQFSVTEDGWQAFTVEQHLARIQLHSSKWRICSINQEYAVCPSYPKRVIVPAHVTDGQLKASAGYRDARRFPVLSYFHEATKSYILRTSQPLVGVQNKRCVEDEQMLNSLVCPEAKGYIIDTRSHAAAVAAQNKGGGFESDLLYPNWKRVHCAVPRWTQYKEALSKMVDACTDSSSDRFFGRLSSCNWLQCVSDALTCACVVAQCVSNTGANQVQPTSPLSPPPETRKETPVLVHGSEGLDATLVVTSLATVMLDKDARTIRGFEALIEREWVSGGHPFNSRCAHMAYASGAMTGAVEAPTFLLFLDAVWQLWAQYSCSFEFSEQLLLALYDHSCASDYGTFVADNDLQRADCDVYMHTVSLWSYLNRPEVLSDYVNLFYEPNDASLWPSIASQSMNLWERLFLRWHRDWTLQDKLLAKMNAIKHQHGDLQRQVLKYTRQLAELETNDN